MKVPIFFLSLSFAGLMYAQDVSPTTPEAPAAGGETKPNPAALPQSRGAGWEKRALSGIEGAAKEPEKVQLVFDGDSITDFWKRADRGLSVWNERYAKYGAVDFGISGDTTENLLWRLSRGQAKGLHPKLICLMIGTNNFKSPETPQEVADGVKEIVSQYQQCCPGSVILLSAIFPRDLSPTSPRRLKVVETNKYLAKLGDGTSVIYMDFGDKFLNPDGTMSKEVMGDLLHPTTHGYEIWADAIQPVIDKYLGQ